MAHHWWICPTNNIVCIHDAPIEINLSSQPANIHLIFWYGTDGEILYNDQLAQRQKITDLTPYIPIFDQWIIAAQDEEPPISLEQAQTIKSEMVDALAFLKKQQPLVYGEYTYDASEKSLNAMAGAISSMSQIIIDQVNEVALGNATTVVGPDMTWITIDGVVVTMPYGDFVALHGLVYLQHEVTGLFALNHKVQIGTLTTVPDVAAYDITQGWEVPPEIRSVRDWHELRQRMR